jgi:hypothetical protein
VNPVASSATFNLLATTAPEPSTLAISGIAVVIGVVSKRRRKRPVV